MSPQLNALDFTLKLQKIRQPGIFQMAVMELLRNSNFDLNQLMGWASKVLMELGSKKDKERKAMDGLDLELLS